MDDYEFMRHLGWEDQEHTTLNHQSTQDQKQSHYRDNSGGSYGSGSGYQKKPFLQKAYSSSSSQGSQTPTYQKPYAPQSNYGGGGFKKQSPYNGGNYRNAYPNQSLSSSKQLTYSSPQPTCKDPSSQPAFRRK